MTRVSNHQKLKDRIRRLITEHPEYREILKRAVEIEENPPNNLIRDYGWEWFHVKAHPAKLTKLVTEDILEVKHKSRRYTNYKLKDREAVKEALKSWKEK